MIEDKYHEFINSLREMQARGLTDIQESVFRKELEILHRYELRKKELLDKFNAVSTKLSEELQVHYFGMELIDLLFPKKIIRKPFFKRDSKLFLPEENKWFDFISKELLEDIRQKCRLIGVEPPEIGVKNNWVFLKQGKVMHLILNRYKLTKENRAQYVIDHVIQLLYSDLLKTKTLFEVKLEVERDFLFEIENVDESTLLEVNEYLSERIDKEFKERIAELEASSEEQPSLEPQIVMPLVERPMIEERQAGSKAVVDETKAPPSERKPVEITLEDATEVKIQELSPVEEEPEKIEKPKKKKAKKAKKAKKKKKKVKKAKKPAKEELPAEEETPEEPEKEEKVVKPKKKKKAKKAKKTKKAKKSKTAKKTKKKKKSKKKKT